MLNCSYCRRKSLSFGIFFPPELCLIPSTTFPMYTHFNSSSKEKKEIFFLRSYDDKYLNKNK